jgi:arylsulfatase A-like enzyme
MAGRLPNLILIMTDHQRCDSIGMVQVGREVCPNLNRLAAEGCFFRRAYNTAPLCAPARTAMFTGKYPTRNGVVYNDFRGETAGDHKVFAECLAEAGYEVAHVGIDHVKVAPPYRERAPFALWCSEGEHKAYLAEHVDGEPFPDPKAFSKQIEVMQFGEPIRRGFSSTRTAVWPYPPEHWLDNYWARQAIDFIRRPHERPFALFLFLWAPHPPLRVPEPYASMFDPDSLDLPANVGVVPECEPANRRGAIAGQLGSGESMEQWRKVWAAHLGLVNLADDAIGHVLRSLDEAGLTDETVVSFGVDHGDHLGQRCMYQKFELYEQAICTPWIVRLPGAPAQSTDVPVSQLDLMPTLGDLTGVRLPGDLDGASLAGCVRQGTAPPERPVFCEFCGSYGRDMDRRAVVTRRYKYIYDPVTIPELYDLADDPLEMHNLAAEARHADTVHELHAAGKAWAESHGDWIEM